MALADGKCTPRIIIVGAGLAGISTAIALKKQLGFENFTIYEKATEVGGTWRDNTYPGCGSDVPGHWYSLSTELNPEWSSYYVNQPEIRAYWEGLYHKYDLPTKTKLGHGVTSAEWDSDCQLYRVEVEEVATGKKIQTEAEIMFYAIGGFMSPMFPKDVGGVEKFRGVAWHSARWRHDVDLKGKRVGVIGNGCSAAQFVPEISADPSVEVINFCRTPQWYLPRGNFHYPKWVQWIFGHVPLAMRLYRNWIMARSDLSFLAFRKNNRILVALTRRLLSLYIKRTAPKDQAAALIPTYAPGCKRIIVDPGYLQALHRPNVAISWDAIKGIVEEGIELRSGKIVPLDIIIFGTGYSTEAVDLRLRGSKKTTAHEYFETQGGGTAYLGTCMPGFPNCFSLLGPNVATGHASVIFSEEAQIGLAIQLIKPILDGKAKSFEVTDEATNRYNTWLQNRLSLSVWTDCHSYYHVGNQKQTKIVATFPGPVALFWWFARRVRWDDFTGVGAEAWEKQRRWNTFGKRGILVGLLALAAGLGYLLNGQPLLELVRRVISSVVG
ncbi:putative L-lysine 6-monooxygenase (NADPH-requiring) [Lyophyllum shimeji]|uniref:L-ornithine N(5)-monooxygenase [NAD(P)H] n=1 Tax=Lyophyllum shimeji TaxID=47721 RepID=A0A9P3PG97_LYOSH|nr:putative L-lysine 6-monooxygenase (NADPH-requiring) [Lyophyllum shimeji]